MLLTIVSHNVGGLVRSDTISRNPIMRNMSSDQVDRALRRAMFIVAAKPRRSGIERRSARSTSLSRERRLIIAFEEIARIAKNRDGAFGPQLIFGETAAEQRDRGKIYFLGRLNVVRRVSDRDRFFRRQIPEGAQRRDKNIDLRLRVRDLVHRRLRIHQAIDLEKLSIVRDFVRLAG